MSKKQEIKRDVKQEVSKELAGTARVVDKQSRREAKKLQKRMVTKQVKTKIPASLGHAYERAIKRKLHSLLYLACVADPSRENACRIPDDRTTMPTGLITPVEAGIWTTTLSNTTCSGVFFPAYGDTYIPDSTNTNQGMIWGIPGLSAVAGTRRFTTTGSFGPDLIRAVRCVGLAVELRSLEPMLTAQGVITAAVLPPTQGNVAFVPNPATLSTYPGAIVCTMSELNANGGVFRMFLTQAPGQIVGAAYNAVDQPYDPWTFRQSTAIIAEGMPRIAIVANGLLPAVTASRFSVRVKACYEFVSNQEVMLAIGGDTERPPAEAAAGMLDMSGALGDEFRGVVRGGSAGAERIGPSQVYETLVSGKVPESGGFLSDWADNLATGLAPIKKASKGIFDAMEWGGHKAIENLPMGDLVDGALSSLGDGLLTLMS